MLTSGDRRITFVKRCKVLNVYTDNVELHQTSALLRKCATFLNIDERDVLQATNVTFCKRRRHASDDVTLATTAMKR